MQRLLADIILVIHALFVAFVVGGLLLTVIGLWRHWRWIRTPWFRIGHLLAIGLVMVQAWLGELCPLTVWESRLRESAGETGYAGSFIQHWLQKLIFYDFPPWVFTFVYTLLAASVVLTWIVAPPRIARTERRDQQWFGQE